MTSRLQRCVAAIALLVLLGPGLGRHPPASMQTPPAARAAAAEVRAGTTRGNPNETPEVQLIARVRQTLEHERELLQEYVYRERRRPVKVSATGKVSVGDEHVYEVYPSADPDRPRRVLLTVGGRPADGSADRAPDQRGPETERQRRDREREDAERRRRAAERLDDAFRVFRFSLRETAVVNGTRTLVVDVIPRPEVKTRSDVGKWMKRFRGTAWIDEQGAQLMRLEMVATDAISIGWGVIGRMAEGTTVMYERRPVGDGLWFPAAARITARGRTLLFRTFDIDSYTEWYDYRPTPPARTIASSQAGSSRPAARGLPTDALKL
jgi:hypothetical protein